LFFSNLTNIPQDLRNCLENALSEEASPSALEAHLPKIRDIIVTLLQGLKAKQAAYRELQGGSDQTPQISMPSPPNMSRSISASARSTNSTNPRLLSEQNLTPSNTVRRNASSPSRINAGGSPVQIPDPMDALKQSDNLERRASRRFSAYTTRGSHPRARSNLRNQDSLKPPSPEPRILELSKDHDREELKDEKTSVNPPPVSSQPKEEVSTEEKSSLEVPSIETEGIRLLLILS
jgi:hypothetical protein